MSHNTIRGHPHTWEWIIDAIRMAMNSPLRGSKMEKMWKIQVIQHTCIVVVVAVVFVVVIYFMAKQITIRQ